MDESTLAQFVAQFEPAEDVTDLDTARRLITCLRATIDAMEEEAYPSEGEHTVVLDANHERMVQVLYRQRKLVPKQEDDVYDEEYEFDDVFLDFVHGWIDVAWDMARDIRLPSDRVTPSA